MKRKNENSNTLHTNWLSESQRNWEKRNSLDRNPGTETDGTRKTSFKTESELLLLKQQIFLITPFTQIRCHIATNQKQQETKVKFDINITIYLMFRA